eukprot:5787012-Pyramimonas_sp.AAC.1
MPCSAMDYTRSMYASRDESCDLLEEGGYVGSGHGWILDGRTDGIKRVMSYLKALQLSTIMSMQCNYG